MKHLLILLMTFFIIGCSTTTTPEKCYTIKGLKEILESVDGEIYNPTLLIISMEGEGLVEFHGCGDRGQFLIEKKWTLTDRYRKWASSGELRSYMKTHNKPFVPDTKYELSFFFERPVPIVENVTPKDGEQMSKGSSLCLDTLVAACDRWQDSIASAASAVTGHWLLTILIVMIAAIFLGVIGGLSSWLNEKLNF